MTVILTTSDGQEMMSHDKFKVLTEQEAHVLAAVETKGGYGKKLKGAEGKEKWATLQW